MWRASQHQSTFIIPKNLTMSKNKTVKPTVHRCSNCGVGFGTLRQRNSHYNHCILEEDDANVPLQNYTVGEFNRQVARGNITPHQLHFGLAYNAQLRDPGPISQQHPPADVPTEEDTPADINVFEGVDDDEIPPPLQRDDDADSSDDEDFGEDDSQPECEEEDMNLDADSFISESALPSMFNDASMLYESRKAKVPSDDSKPRCRKQPPGELSYTFILRLVI